MLVHLSAPNEKCLVLNEWPCSQVTDLPFLRPLLWFPRETQTTLAKCVMCMNTCGIALDTTDLGGGVSFLSSFSRNRRKPKGREREGVSKAERGGGHAIYRHGQGIYIFK